MAAPIVELSNIPDTVITPVAGDGNAPELAPEEEPKPAWTQSYSVTSQPGSPRISPKEVPEEIPEVEEEVKPSWTRSYSVTSQPGSPRVSPKEDLEEPTLEPIAVADEPTEIVTPPVGEAVSASAEAETVERPKSPWTPSYSVTTLESQAERAPLENAGPESETAPAPATLVEETVETKLETDPPVPDVLPSDSLDAKEGTERPKSPWTPSYSVTTLPGSAPAEPGTSYS